MKSNLLIVYLVAAGDGISGGSRIHIECTKKWLANKTFRSVTVWASDDGYRTCVKYGVDPSALRLMSTLWAKKINFWFDYGIRIIKGTWLSLWYPLDREEHYYLYAASDFWADFFPALIIHLRYRSTTTLISPIYLFSPRPGTGYDGKPAQNGKLLIYYCMQQVMMFFARRYSQGMFVTYDPDLQRLQKLGFAKQPHFVIVGGIEFAETDPYVKKHDYEYDAVFVGRYHVQKGIFQLLEIWKLVVEDRPEAKLALLGNGDANMERAIKSFIDWHHLADNIFLLGFRDGAEKYTLFSKTKVYLNTNLYDAGGMATMEAMSCGLPVVSFDFPNSRSMIGDGVLWARYLDVQDFVKKVLTFLDNPEKICAFGLRAREDMKKYDWNVTARRMVGYFEECRVTSL